MKKESMFRYVLRLTLTLLIIAAVVAAAMALVNQVTEPIIAKAQLEKTRQAIEIVLPGGYDTEITDFTDPSGLVTKVYKGAQGYALEVTPAGFDGTITMMVGVSLDGKVLGISVVSHTETAGLGAVSAAKTAAGQAFRDQFIGQSGSVQVTKDGGTMDAITGATVTSRAICAGINAALACVAALGGA